MKGDPVALVLRPRLVTSDPVCLLCDVRREQNERSANERKQSKL